MKQDKIEELAKHLGEVPQYVGYRNRDNQLNLGGYESQPFDNPSDAFAAAKREAESTRYTRLEYGVRVYLGHEVVVTDIDDFSGTT
jgi:hypothetical protein